MKILRKTTHLIKEVDSFWDTIGRAALVFKGGSIDYFDNNFERLKDRAKQIDELENEADLLRRNIKLKLYTEMLIPESRGDVLGLLETSDNVIDRTKKVLHALELEKPRIPEFLVSDFKDLCHASANAMDEMVKASRSFFYEIQLINDFINKCYFYEHEADKLEDQIKRKAFDSPEVTRLSHKVHIRYFAEKISALSDEAEAVCERLSIYSIKRSI